MFPISYYKNVDKCCRTCLNDSSSKMYDIFGLQTNPSLVDILSFCTAIKVDKDDSLPKKLCSGCYNCLVSFYDFRKQAEKVDAELRKTEITVDTIDDRDAVDVKIENDVDFDDRIEVLEQDYNENEVKEEVHNPPVLHNNSLQYECKVCQKQFYTKVEYKNHSQTHRVKYKCSICKESFRTLPKLESHKAKHKKSLYTCKCCLITFSHKSELTKHSCQDSQTVAEPLSTSQDDQNQIVKCDFCSANFRSTKALSAHMRVHKDKDRVLACSVCAKVFQKVSHVKRHELSHSVNRPFKCTKCPRSFASETCFKEHLNDHCGIKPHTCPICAKSFGSTTTLKTHLRVHKKEKLFMCAICGKKFDCNKNLEQHTKRHIGLKSFACELCPGRFVSKGELKSHIITHTGEKSYSCDQCSAVFTKGSSLRQHKLAHLGIKPYQCDTCFGRFRSKNHLTRHHRIHTGEKPYICDICDRAFTQSGDLLKHRRAHVGDKLYSCSDCPESFRLKTELRQHISEHFISSRLQALSVDKAVENPIPTNMEDSGIVIMVVEPQTTELNGTEANSVTANEKSGTQGTDNTNSYTLPNESVNQ